MKLKHKTAILTTPDNKLIQLEWSELEEVNEGNKVRIAGTEYEVTALDWAFCDRVLREGAQYVEAK
jgi:hypothetical protein